MNLRKLFNCARPEVKQDMKFFIEETNGKWWAFQIYIKTEKYVYSEKFETKEEAEDKRDEYERDYLNR